MRRVFCLAAVFLYCVGTGAQQPVAPSFDESVYRRVSDILFPRGRVDRDQEYKIVLLFTSPVGTPVQYTIVRTRDQKFTIIRRALKRDTYLLRQMEELKDKPYRNDPEELAKRIEVVTNIIHPPPSTMESLIGEYTHLRLSPLLDTSIILDAVGYELWFDAPSQALYLSLSGNDSPVAKWMDRTQLTLDKLIFQPSRSR